MRIFTLSLLVLLLACEPAEQQARDSIAAASGVITAAQATLTPTCKANPSQNSCQLVNKAIAAENLAVSALETYCGIPAGVPSGNNCAPVKSYQSALTTALQNLNTIITELKGVV